jgi:transcription initiation factor IIE alpha subunit
MTYHCVVCKFEVEQDDAVIPTEGGLCTCRRCYERLTETECKVSVRLRQDVEDAMRDASGTS